VGIIRVRKPDLVFSSADAELISEVIAEGGSGTYALTVFVTAYDGMP